MNEKRLPIVAFLRVFSSNLGRISGLLNKSSRFDIVTLSYQQRHGFPVILITCKQVNLSQVYLKDMTRTITSCTFMINWQIF